MTVGRNDPCPCGSGKKYKKCCETKDTHLAELPFPTIPEQEAISNLLNESPNFRQLYESERRKISKPIYWGEDPTLKDGITGRSSRGQRGYKLMHLARAPAHISEAVDVAHELLHFVLDAEGFPLAISSSPELYNVATVLSSLPSDQLIDQRLIGFGFDVYEKYRLERASTIAQLANRPYPPSARLENLEWKIKYAGHVIDWEHFCKQHEAVDEFQSMFDEKYPEVASAGKELVAIIRENDYETPGNMALLFKRTVLFLGLENDIDIWYE